MTGILIYDEGADRPLVSRWPDDDIYLHCGDVVQIGGEHLRIEMTMGGAWAALGSDGQPRPVWGQTVTKL